MYWICIGLWGELSRDDYEELGCAMEREEIPPERITVDP